MNEILTESRRRQLARLNKVGILVVDNDPQIRDLMKTVLERLGFRKLYFACDGFEGVDVLEAHPRHIDLVITDWELKPMVELSACDVEPNGVISSIWAVAPPTDGASFVRYLRSSPASPNRYIPIIMLTGPTLVDNIQYARDCGVSEILKKPISAKLLCDRIISCIESQRCFITAPTYKGPDRRHRRMDITEDRRKIDIKVIRYAR